MVAVNAVKSINSHYHEICDEISTLQFTEKGDLALLENLVKKSPGVLCEKDENGASPLHHAVAGGYVSLIHYITSLIDPQGRH